MKFFTTINAAGPPPSDYFLVDAPEATSVTDDRSNVYTKHDSYWMSCHGTLAPSTVTVGYNGVPNKPATLYWVGMDMGSDL